MATSYLILGQAQAGTSATLLYSVPTSTSAVVSTIVICNTTNTAETISLFANKAGTTSAAPNALIYQQTIPAYTTQTYTLGITLTNTGTADTLYIQSNAATAITVTAFGSQIS